MARILAIDYGRKRCGVAVTDSLKISANGLPTLETPRLLAWVKEYVGREAVERILVGEPKQTNGQPSESMKYITPFVNRLRKELPEIPVEMVDERFTSVIAHREMLAGGFKKSDRQRKGFADEMSAVIILTSWLDSHSF
ncbi:MAG: Holliday junction resolvase RuvX [Muribaculaceae bacterium]|nr:Holliday junction resolvase RuvX [Muribaculaceae bacterium]MDE6683491.1 Holliday junction resolvase RuvX [Muribaculaceae bacterium]